VQPPSKSFINSRNNIGPKTLPLAYHIAFRMAKINPYLMKDDIADDLE